MADRRPVLVYRETLLAASEPFITAQGEGLVEHEPWYLALRRADGHPLPPARDLRWRPLPLVEPARRAAWKRWGLGPATVRAVRRLAPVLVHAHFGRDAVQVLPLAARLGLPLITTFHGHDATRTDADLGAGSRSDRLFLARRDDLARRGARFLAVSSVVRDRLLERGFPAERVELHHIGVDVDGIDAAASATGHDPALVVFAGRLVPHKGLDDLLHALAPLGARVRLEVIGDGPSRAGFEAQARALGVDATFHGFRSQADTWAAMGRAGVAVVPSRTGDDGWQEAFGLVAAEAQAAGTPVIAARCGGLPEAVSPACEHLLVAERDVGAMTANLERLLGDAVGAARMGAEARAWVRAHRNLAVQNRRLDAIYREVAP